MTLCNNTLYDLDIEGLPRYDDPCDPIDVVAWMDWINGD